MNDRKAFRNIKNIGVFLCFLAFSFLSFTILNPIVESNAETVIKDYTVGAYTMSMTNTSEVDVTATTNNDQQLYTAENDVIFRNTCPKGAKIAISSKSGTNVLSDGEGNEILATAPGSELSDNSWGFSLDAGETWNSVPAVLEDVDPLLIYSGDEAELEDRTIPILYGFKLSREIPDGTYSNDVVYTLTPDQDCFIYKINWEGNGGTIPDGFPEYLNQDDLLDLSALPRPTRDYYDFAGWRVGDATYTGDETAVDLNLNNDPSITVVTLWTPTVYPISYNLDGGSATNETNYNIESDEIALTNPTRRGYTFRGWSGTDLIGDTNTLVTIPTGSHGDRYYTANWDVIPYALTYTLNGGAAENSPTYNIETPTFMLQNPARTAYDFVGWSGTGLIGNYNKEVAIPTGSTGDRSFEAHWTPTDYTISYSLKGGAAENPTNYNIESNAITLNNPSRGAYDFDGWSGTELTGTANKSVTIRKGSYGNRAYAANWSPTTYSISYTLNGGSASNPTTYNVESGEISISNPTKANYDFVGWSGTGLTGNNNKNVKIPASSSGNRSYEAHWTPTNYSVSYTLNGGSASGNPTSYNVESNAFTLNNPTRTAYDFVGWSGTGLTGNNNKSVTVAKGSSGNRSYTANWTPTNYTISYTLNGGSATNNTSYNVETNSFTLNNPTRAAYDFVGWSGTDLSGTGNKTVTIPKGSTGNRSYTANWTPTTYTITYNLNGGSASNNTTYTIETNSFTLNNPTRANYNFTGWSGTGLSGTGNKSVTVAKGSSGNRSYTANWAPICSFTSQDFGYTGGVQSWTVPTGCGGTYKLEVWGGQGGSNGNDKSLGGGAGGGYAAGNVSLQAGNVLYVVVGGAGMKGGCGWSTGKDDYTAYGGYNGGGTGKWLGTGDNANYNVVASGGGGATHIGKTNALLKNTAVGNLYIVAGGGGGTGNSCAAGRGSQSPGGSGGGTNGGSTSSTNYGGNDTQTTRPGATQSSGYAYGQGGDYGGGGGYYGGYGATGGASWSSSDGGNGWVAGATGGSGYVGGVTGGTMSNGVRAGHGYARITKV